MKLDHKAKLTEKHRLKWLRFFASAAVAPQTASASAADSADQPPAAAARRDIIQGDYG